MAFLKPKVIKQFYSIAEVSELFDLPASTLRFWEKEFPQLHPRKGNRSIRQYTEKDIEVVEAIHNLVKKRGLKIEAAREMLKKNQTGTANTAEALQRLKSLRAELVELRKGLNLITP